jgi:hypothetical protein
MALQTTDRCAQHSTWGYFAAYRDSGHQGKKNQWLNEEIDEIANYFPNDYTIYG